MTALSLASDFIKAHEGCRLIAYIVVWVDAININVRTRSGASAFNLNNKTTGAAFNTTNANWYLAFAARL